jgi:peroxiredoxin
VGNTAPDFSASTLDGGSTSLSSYRGQVVLLNFWATWCPPCRTEMPDMQAFYQEYQAQGVIVLAVNVQEDGGTVNNLRNEYGLTFPILLDGSGQVKDAYNARALPKTYFIDRGGVIRQIQIGDMSRQQMVDAVTPLL